MMEKYLYRIPTTNYHPNHMPSKNLVVNLSLENDLVEAAFPE